MEGVMQGIAAYASSCLVHAVSRFQGERHFRFYRRAALINSFTFCLSASRSGSAKLESSVLTPLVVQRVVGFLACMGWVRAEMAETVTSFGSTLNRHCSRFIGNRSALTKHGSPMTQNPSALTDHC
jgi:hypothetical protein